MALLALVAALAAGCVSFTWNRTLSYEPIPPGALAELTPGRDTLTQCLDRLGPPLYAWEYKIDGAALAWGWADRDQKGISISVPLQDWYSASFGYDDASDDLVGAVLLFDRDLVLEQVKEGRLRDLERLTGRVRRPAAPADASGSLPPDGG